MQRIIKFIPVLMYHHTSQHKGDIVTVTPQTFEMQIAYLYKSNYKSLKIDELLSYIRGNFKPFCKCIVLTFDDGWLDNYIYAYPILKKYRMNFAIFLVTKRVDIASNSKFHIPYFIPSHEESKTCIKKEQSHKVVLNWNLINEMKASNLAEFYSHTKGHFRCDELSEKKLIEELFISKKVIEENLNIRCDYLCWPYGKYNEIGVRIAKDIGYNAIFTTIDGVVEKFSSPFYIKRIEIKDDIEWFKQRLSVYN